MASTYALPGGGGSSHTHSHSYSGIHLSPGKAAANSYANSNGSPGKHASPNGFLFTHAETSRETSPIHFPHGELQYDKPLNSFEQNISVFQENSNQSKHKHNHSAPAMKSRPRGESDLGRAANPVNTSYERVSDARLSSLQSWFSLPEALTSLLVTVPYVLSSAAYSSMSGMPSFNFPPLPTYAAISLSDESALEMADARLNLKSHGFIDASVIASGTLLVVGICAKMQSPERGIHKDKETKGTSTNLKNFLSRSYLRSMAINTLSIWLPLYASMLIGGSRAGLVILVSITAGIICSSDPNESLLNQWKQCWASKVATSMVFLVSFMADEVGLTIATPVTDLILGYLALGLSILVLPPSFSRLADVSPTRFDSKRNSPILKSQASTDRDSINNKQPAMVSPLIRSGSGSEVDMTLVSGIALAILTVFASVILGYSPSISTSSLLLITLSIASMAAAILLSQPTTLRSQSKAGLALGCLVTASSSFLFSPSLWPGTVCNGGLSALSFLGILYDTHWHSSRHDDHDHVHHTHTNSHSHKKHSNTSILTNFLLARCEPGSLFYGILKEKDSRRIAYFTALNFSFMFVQGIYGYLSGSLGLLSDTVHMLFDCLGLVVGLGAAVASRWPTSPEKPYGWGKLNTLSGFGNGIFLMLVSVEFTWEAIEGILEQRELRHVEELLIVSVLGLLVNLVGLVFFGHAHHGHDHGHDHGHSHSHSQPHDHKHTHDRSHALKHKHSASSIRSHGKSNSQGHLKNHEHHHDSHGGNENLHGIFLHVAADAGGSLAVIISTALNLWKPWFVWDPLATIIIAALIFAAAVPLVISSGQKLLLVNPPELEYNIKNALQDLADLRGVVGYSVPRFWIDDKDEAAEIHGHDHGSHDHSGRKRIIGVIHVVAASSTDLNEVQERVEAFLAERNMHIVIQMEREGDGQCWCGSTTKQVE